MSFSVEYLPNREEVQKESDEKCREQAAILSTVSWSFVDPDFFPDARSIGNRPEKELTKNKKDYENVNEPWFPPYQLMTSWSRTDGNKWQVWDDPWPFHVCQGDTGDCWLMAVLMTIARRKELLEQIIPKRHYTLKHGIVQVRLFVDGKWQVIRTDFHIPQQNGIERFSQLTGNQTWVAFIEKAFAKLKGSYGHLYGGLPEEAYRCLTGAHSRRILLERDLDIDGLWEDLAKYHSSGFLLAAATPLVHEEETLKKVFYDYYSIEANHAYAILDFKKYGMHRLIQLGNPNSVRWNGKWSEMASYNDTTSKKFSELDRTLSNAKVFWMSIEDFVRFFSAMYVCEYQEGWTDYQFKQKIIRASRQDGLIIRLNIETPTDVNIEAHVEIESGENVEQVFLNIHRATNENQCGELIKSVYNQDCKLTTGGLTLVPGTYLVVMVFCEIVPKLDVNWMIKSSSPLSFHFVSCPFSLFVDSLQQVIMKHGKIDKEDEEFTFFRLYQDDCIYIMAENRMNYGYFEIQGNLKNTDAYKSKSKNCFDSPMFLAPMTRRIVGVKLFNIDFHSDETYYEYNIKYSLLFRIWKLYGSVNAELEEIYEPIKVTKDLNQSEV